MTKNATRTPVFRCSAGLQPVRRFSAGKTPPTPTPATLTSGAGPKAQPANAHSGRPQPIAASRTTPQTPAIRRSAGLQPARRFNAGKNPPTPTAATLTSGAGPKAQPANWPLATLVHRLVRQSFSGGGSLGVGRGHWPLLLLLLLALPAANAQAPLRLTLAEAEQIARQNNPAISSARYNAEAFREVPKELRSAYQPTAFGSITGAGASDGSRIAAGALNNPVIYNRFASGIGASQLLTDFGRTGNLVSSADSRALAQQENTKATTANTLLAVDTAYFNVLRARNVLTVAQQTVSARQLIANQITTLAQNSLKSNLDVSFANVNLADAQLLLAGAQNDLKAAEAALANAIGYPNQRYFTLAEEDIPEAPPSDPNSLIAEALRNRPELSGLRFETEAAAKYAKAERDLWMPSISAVGSVGLVPVGVAALQNQYGAVGVNVNIPIFNGGLFKARRAEAELRTRSTEEHLKDIQNRVVQAVQTAWLTAQTGYERIGLTQKLLEQSKLALDLAKSRYDLGLSSIIELSQAQLNDTAARIAVAEARYNYQSEWRALQYQIGALR